MRTPGVTAGEVPAAVYEPADGVEEQEGALQGDGDLRRTVAHAGKDGDPGGDVQHLPMR